MIRESDVASTPTCCDTENIPKSRFDFLMRPHSSSFDTAPFVAGEMLRVVVMVLP
jgi:hypothetical protein